MTRYRVEPTGKGFWPYCVRAGDGTRELFVGHKKSCERVAAELATAYSDGEFVGGQGCDALLAERDQLRAEVEKRQLTIDGMNEKHWELVQAHAQLRAEVAMLRSYEAEWERSLNQLRAELEAIRKQQPVAFAAFAGKGNIRIWSTNRNEVCAQAIKLGLATTSLYALPPQQPDAVSVPRELLERLARQCNCCSTTDALDALISTKNAEEV